ncbi:MAG: hypothetical protein IKU24_01070 [Clostridia bacterium]|nr:hypothetical protein [Clostridia bacterium]
MKFQKYITTALLGAFVLFFSLWCIFVPTPDYSVSERRQLASFPELTLENVLSGKFSGEFEEYATDRFPLREKFFAVKSYVRLFVLQQKENNDIFVKDGHISKLEYPQNEAMQEYAAELFKKVWEKNFPENDVYFCMIPDKNLFLADLKMDYDALEKTMKEKMPFATFIEITSLLSASDYYFTDSHWRQDKILPVAEKISSTMGVNLPTEYETKKLDIPFYGVYQGQSALSFPPDEISYLTNATIEGFTVEGAAAVYDMKKAEGQDPYEFFLSGNQPLVKIKNEQNADGKKLVVFRDSFASSLMPLLAQGYSEVVLVDLRYMNSALLENFVSFEGCDVLFLYSASILNHANSMR